MSDSLHLYPAMQRGLGGFPHERLHQDMGGGSVVTTEATSCFRSVREPG
ncbi:hypothetical protein [Moorena sp. SIO4G3]|nr:hypothetical protein [Moorena sp. SIO4G3]